MDVIILFGEIISLVKRSRDACQFSLKTATGLFHIKVKVTDAGPLKKMCAGTLRRGQRVSVTATPHSFVSRSCNSHHVYFEATAVTVIDSGDQDAPTE